MRRITLLLSLVLVLSFQVAKAQNEEITPKLNHLDLSIGTAQDANMLRFSYTHYWAFGAKQRLQLGAGVRFLSVFGDSWRMAEVNTANNADGGLDENAILTKDVTLGGLNAGFYFKYGISPKWELGLNFDIIGLGFANEKGTNYVASSNGQSTAVSSIGSPNPNIAFTRGQVSSDNLWLGFNALENFQVRVGYNFTGVELEVSDLPQELEDPRFERINSMFIFGLGYYF